MSARVLVVRDPDYETEILTEGDVQVVTVDLGQSFNGPKRFTTDLDADEQREWIDATRASVAKLPAESVIRLRVEELCLELSGDA
jgi:hypothetical protein